LPRALFFLEIALFLFLPENLPKILFRTIRFTDGIFNVEFPPRRVLGNVFPDLIQ